MANNYFRMAILFIFITFAELCPADIKFSSPVSIFPSIPKMGEKISVKTEFGISAAEAGLIIIGGIDSEVAYRKVIDKFAVFLKEPAQFVWKAEAGNHRAWFKILRYADDSTTPQFLDMTELLFIVQGGPGSTPWADVSSMEASKLRSSEYHLSGDLLRKLPDLIFSDQPDRYLIAYMNEKISVPVTVLNSGDTESAASSVLVSCIERGETTVQSLQIPVLKPGEQIVVKAEYIPQTQWDILCDIKVDPDRLIEEYNEENNSGRFTLQIWTKSLPDLIPYLAYSVIKPDEIRWRLTVRNMGETESPVIEYTTSFICKGGTSEIQHSETTSVFPVIPELSPKQSFIVTGAHKLDGDICVFSVKVDALDKLKEKNEDNNSAEIIIRLK